MSRRQRRPLSPEAAAVVRAMSGGRLSRRSMLTGMGALGLGAGLAGCSTGGTTTTGGSGGDQAKPTPAADRSDTDKMVNWANWTLYLDYDSKTKKYPTLEHFQSTTGIKATYSEDIEDNDSYYAKIQAQLKLGQDFGKDVAVFTDWMMARCIRQGFAQKFDKTLMPNVAKNLLPKFANPDYDPGRNYSVTWQSGFAGLAWNKQAVADLLGIKDPEQARLTTVTDLWNPKLKGRVEVLSEMRDTIGLIMMDQGADITKFGAKEFNNALGVLRTQLNNGQIRQVKGNSYAEDLKSGDAVACFAWSGDITQIQQDPKYKDKFEFVLPDHGGTLWADNMWIPVGSPHKKNAEILMNYYYDPMVAATVADYVNYICPVAGAKEAMHTVDAAQVSNNLIFPSDAYLNNAHIFRTLTPAEETEFSKAFQKVLGV